MPPDNMGYDIAKVDLTKSHENLMAGNQDEANYGYALLKDPSIGQSAEGTQPPANPTNVETPKQIHDEEQKSVEIQKSVEKQQPVSPQQNVEPPVNGPPDPITPQENTFNGNYGGQPVQMDDPDGFMGRKDIVGLKNSWLNSQQHLVFQKEQMEKADESARGAISKQQQEIENLTNERDNYKQQLISNRNTVAPLTENLPVPPQVPGSPGSLGIVPPILPQTVKPNENTGYQQVAPQSYQSPQPSALPVPPQEQQPNVFNSGYQTEQGLSPLKPLNLQGDAVDWDGTQSAEISTAYNSMNQHITAQDQKIKALIDMQTQNNRLQEETAQAAKKQSDQVSQDLRTKNFYGEINSFVKSHPEFSDINEGIEAFDAKMGDWMDRNALANGVQRPYANATAYEFDNYTNQKLFYAKQYLNGDPTVKTRSEFAPAPPGAQKYLELTDLTKKWNGYSNNGTTNFTLEQAYVLENYGNGNLQNGIQTAKIQSRKEGADAMARVVQANNQNYAVNMPNTATQTAPPQVDINNLTLEQQKSILNSDQADLDRNPELKQKHEALTNMINQRMGYKK